MVVQETNECFQCPGFTCFISYILSPTIVGPLFGNKSDKMQGQRLSLITTEASQVIQHDTERTGKREAGTRCGLAIQSLSVLVALKS